MIEFKSRFRSTTGARISMLEPRASSQDFSEDWTLGLAVTDWKIP